MLTTNIDINDRLTNGQMDAIKKNSYQSNCKQPSVIYVNFNDLQAGIKTIQKMSRFFWLENILLYQLNPF